MFDGSAYCGFQSQKNGRSVQEVLTQGLSQLFGLSCSVTGCSRTDAGVHALGFCATVEPRKAQTADKAKEGPPADPFCERAFGPIAPLPPWCAIPLEKIPLAAERCLPPDVAVLSARAVPDTFHPRYDAVGKEYLYKISDAPTRNPFLNNRAWQIRRPLSPESLKAMEKAASYLSGYRSYASFMAAGSKITDPRRTVTRCSVSRDETGLVVIRIAADGFLYHMVRIIAGTLLDVAGGTFSPGEMPAILSAEDRSAAGRTAPACGLYLNAVTYRLPHETREERDALSFANPQKGAEPS